MRYDIEGRLVTHTNGTRVEYDRRQDGPRIEYVKDERGLITRTDFDFFRNVIRVEHPDGSVEQWKYQPNSNRVIEYIDPLQVKATYEYDAKGNMDKVTQAVGTPLERVIEQAFDTLGRRTRITQKGPTPDKDVNTQFEWDNYGNLTQITDAENNVRDMEHDVMGNVKKEIDARRKVRTMEYNAAGWLMNSISALNFVSEFTYDDNGNRLTSTIPISATETATTIYRYDELDRLYETEDPLGKITQQRYDEEGRMYESEDARGVITRMEYDATSRLIKTIDGANNEIETLYGDASNALEGLVAERKYPTYRERYKYDERNRIKETEQILSPSLSYKSSMDYVLRAHLPSHVVPNY
jgi:YD repeat-containing protein